MVRTLEGKHPGYFEAILQLRDTTPEAVKFAEAEIKREQIPLVKKLKVKNGWDYYLADSDFTKALGKKLQHLFGGEQMTTASLHTHKEGKDIYRLTVLFRGASFRKGDLVEFQGEKHEVKILGKNLVLQNLKTGEKKRMKYREMKQIKLIENRD